MKRTLVALAATALFLTACDQDEITSAATEQESAPEQLDELAALAIKPPIEIMPSCRGVSGALGGGSQDGTALETMLFLTGTPGQPYTDGSPPPALPLYPGGGSVDSLVGGLLPPYDISGGLRPSEAQDVNIHETFVGYTGPAGLPKASVRYAGDAAWTVLSLSGSPTWSIAYSVNDADQIALTKGGPAYGQNPRAAVFSGGSEIVLPIPSGYAQSYAYAINNYGQVVGYVRGSGGWPFHAVMWQPSSPNGTSYTAHVIVATAPPVAATAYGLNENGQVTGSLLDVPAAYGSRSVGGSGMFVWTPTSANGTTGSYVNHGTPPNTFTAEGRDINDNGEVVGNSTHVTPQNTMASPTVYKDVNLAFHWEAGTYTIITPPKGGRLSQYGTAAPDSTRQGGVTTHAYAINNYGTVVGRAATEYTFFEQRMSLWDADTQVMELYAKLPSTCSSAGFGINECGVVAGWSLDPQAPEGQNTYANKWGTCAIGVTKTAPEETVTAGDYARYTLKVQNLSTRAAENVSMTDDLPGGPGILWEIEDGPTQCSITGSGPQTLSCLFPSLERGGGFREVTVRSPTPDESCQEYTNTVSVTADGRVPGADTASLTVHCPPRLYAEKRLATESELDGDAIGFALEVGNNGRGTATAVTLTDTLPANPAGAWQVSAPQAYGCSISSRVLTCDLGNLVQDDVRRVLVTTPTVANECREYPNRAWFGAENHATLSDSATVSVNCAEIEITKSAAAETVMPGDPVSFTVTVNSIGGGPADNVTVTDELPTGLGIEWTLASSTDACSITSTLPQTLSCNFGSVPAGESVSVTVTSETVNPSCGEYHNTASASADGLGTVSASASVNVPCQPPHNDGVCEGGVTLMSVKYIGTDPLTGAIAGQRVAPGTGPLQEAEVLGLGSYAVYTFAIQSVGGTFDGVANGRLANEFKVFIGDTEVDQVHMSCSQPIYIGMPIGDDLEIVDLRFVGGDKGGTGGGNDNGGDNGNGNGKDKGNKGNKGGNGGGNGGGSDDGGNGDGGNGGTSSLTTFTIGGWGSTPSGNNPGRLLHDNFAQVYPQGVEIGDGITAHFSSAQAVTDFLPSGGTAGTLDGNLTDPTGTTSAGVFASQVLALTLSVDFSAAGVTGSGLGSGVLASGKLAGWTVAEVLAAANTALGGGPLPAGVSLTDLNDIVDRINNNYVDGNQNNGFVDASGDSGAAPADDGGGDSGKKDKKNKDKKNKGKG